MFILQNVMSLSVFETFVVLLLLFSGSQACNPPSQNTTSSQSPPTTISPRIITISTNTSSFLTSDNITPTPLMEKVTSPKLEEHTINCHYDYNNGSSDERNGDYQSYQRIVISGLPFQRGESHGRQAKRKILSLISFYKTSSAMPIWSDCITFVKDNYLEALQQYCPNCIEEMRGISKGAGVNLEDILILNSRYELSSWKRSQRVKINKGYFEKKRASSDIPACSIKQPNISTTETQTAFQYNDNDNIISGGDECTGAVALSSSTKYAHVLLGQNWDADEFFFINDAVILLEVHPDPCEDIKPFVMLAEAGQLGFSGMNSDGLGIVAMSLRSSGDNFTKTGTGWIPSGVLKRMFVEAPNFSLGLQLLLSAPIHVSLNVIVGTAEDEALNIELTPTSYFTSQVPLKHEFMSHSNHFKAAVFMAQNDIKDESHCSTSLLRDRRVERHLMNAWPRITEESFQTAFKDHVGPVCVHTGSDDITRTTAFSNKTTVASVIYNLSQRTLQISKGPPCIRAYRDYCFEFSQV